MAKIVFFCIPAHGHTNPTLGVVRELVNRGHEVWYYSYEMMREKIEAAGARFMACDRFDAEKRLTPKQAARVGADIALSIKVLVDTTLALNDPVCAELQTMQPDCIVADSMAVWGKAIAQKLGIPFVCSTTTFAFNRYSARIMPQDGKQVFSLLLALPRLKRELRRLQRNGYPIHFVLELIQSDEHTHTIVYTSPQFQPCADTFPPERFAFVGPSIRPVEQPYLKRRHKMVYVSMGTVNNDMIPLYRRCIQALRQMDCEAVLAVGQQADLALLGEWPEQIHVHAQVDQIAVLAQADAFLSHCGMNSASEALYFGVPLLMYPQTSEQKGVAARISQLEAGIWLKDASVEGIRASLEKLLNTPSYAQNAQSIGDGFRQCSGAAGAADKILSLC